MELDQNATQLYTWEALKAVQIMSKIIVEDSSNIPPQQGNMRVSSGYREIDVNKKADDLAMICGI